MDPTADFLSVIEQFKAPVVKDSEIVIPTFDVESAPLKELPKELISESAQKAPNIVTRSLLALKRVTLDGDDGEDALIREEYFLAIRKASRLPESVLLETFNPFHMECASVLVNVFCKIQSKNLTKAVEYAKTQVNPYLLNYALSVALRHRPDALQVNLQIPSHVCTMPQMYVDMNNVNNKFHAYKANENSSGCKKPLYIDINSAYTATDLDLEHRVAYFREDIGVNLHHRHWHEVYPFIGGEQIVKKDRRGELFYYMHQQMLARYNFERLSNGLVRTEPYSNIRAPIEQAYFPKLDSAANTKIWCPRQANATLQDLRRNDVAFCRLSELERWRDRIFEAIDRGYAYKKDPETGDEILLKLVEPQAINDLGNSIESVPALSWNSDYYGDLHNKGHLFISYCHDPDKRFNEEGSVMSHSETAVRDPIFYRWHAYIDDIFQHYKRKLKAYTKDERSFDGVKIEKVEVQSEKVPFKLKEESTEDSQSSPKKNILTTFWQKDAVDITQGILNRDAKKDGQVFAKFTHLQHSEFVYNIEVTNSLAKDVTGTVRIFIAPQCDESGVQMKFNKQRRFFVELDKFTTTLKPGANNIERKSTESSVTIPFEQSFMTTEQAKMYTKDTTLNTNMLSYCGCGWPQHLLIGRGSAGGFPCDLFVMITDYEKDKVDENNTSALQNKECCVKSAVSFCGIRDKKFPDSKPMGFPFDRNIEDHYSTINDFLTKSQLSPEAKKKKEEKHEALPEYDDPLPNMKVVTVKVLFFDKTVNGPTIPQDENKTSAS